MIRSTKTKLALTFCGGLMCAILLDRVISYPPFLVSTESAIYNAKQFCSQVTIGMNTGQLTQLAYSLGTPKWEVLNLSRFEVGGNDAVCHLVLDPTAATVISKEVSFAPIQY